MLLLGVSTPQGPELHLDAYGRHALLVLLNVSKLQWPELHMDVSTLYVGCRDVCVQERFTIYKAVKMN